MSYTLNIRGRLMGLDRPLVMGILNATPDSFFEGSRKQTEHDVAQRACEIVEQGGDIIDVGAFSTRPGAADVTQQEETERLRMALGTVRRELPEAIVSVDTFRADVARMAVEEFGADIINDISEGTGRNILGANGPQCGGSEGLDAAPTAEMFRMVTRLRVPYILTSVQPSLRDTLLVLARKVQQLRDLGQKDIILDPGFGFGKTVEENFRLMKELDKLRVMELPLLVGISRKSMIFRTLGGTPADSLNGTTVLNTVALMKGASILRVHDVREAAECCRLCSMVNA